MLKNFLIIPRIHNRNCSLFTKKINFNNYGLFCKKWCSGNLTNDNECIGKVKYIYNHNIKKSNIENIPLNIINLKKPVEINIDINSYTFDNNDKKITNTICDNTHNNTNYNTNDKTNDKINDNTNDNINDNTHDNTHDNTNDNTHDNTNDNTYNNRDYFYKKDCDLANMAILLTCITTCISIFFITFYKIIFLFPIIFCAYVIILLLF